MPDANAAIGVFDSGMGGLTVLRELMSVLPDESFIYLGDTARLPYGTKSPETVIHYALSNAKLLLERPLKLLVVACNTVSAVALAPLRRYFPHIPIIGVLEPGAKAAVAASHNKRIAVLATEATTQAGGYQRLIQKLAPQAQVMAHSASLLVALAEEGWVDNAVAFAALREYLQPIINQTEACDCLVLGCTHFPVFMPVLNQLLTSDISIIDSATATAQAVKQRLLELQLVSMPGSMTPTTHFWVTDNPERFQAVSRVFLSQPIVENQITLVDNHTALSDIV